MEQNKNIGNKRRWKEGVYDPKPIYYVYGWRDKENGHIFYVGKGTGDRYKTKAPSKRNRFFIRYVNAHDCEPSIIKNGLTEKEAFGLEKETIAKYRLSSQSWRKKRWEKQFPVWNKTPGSDVSQTI